MKAIWINEGDELVPERVRSYGIDTVFFSERKHTVAHIKMARQYNFEVGVYSNPQWYDYPSPADFRTLLSKAVTRLDGDGKQMSVQINYEPHKPTWIIEYFYWWRRVRPARETSWCLEGFQAGWAAEAILHPNLAGTFISPQCYDGGMKPWDSAGVVKDLVDWGVQFDRIEPMIDAQDAGRRGWQGFAYLQNRLPD